MQDLVVDPLYMHVLHDVDESTITYSTNRRNGVDMDVVIRELDGGAERVVYDGGGYVGATEVSHDKGGLKGLSQHLLMWSVGDASERSAKSASCSLLGPDPGR